MAMDLNKRENPALEKLEPLIAIEATMIDKLGSFLRQLKPQYDDDSIDRLNYIYTNMILIACAMTIGMKQYVGEPLQCWVPAQFKGGWESYVENYCFVENTYFISMDNRLPARESGIREQRELSYYQWVPFVLALQALMFYTPRLVWQMFSSKSGIQVTQMLQRAQMTKKGGGIKMLKDSIKAEVENVAAHIEMHRNHYQRKMEIDSGVTMCDFEVRQLGNNHNWSVQCVLMINMVNEKIYIFLWYWFLLVMVATFVNLVYWVLLALLPGLEENFIKKYLMYKKCISGERSANYAYQKGISGDNSDYDEQSAVKEFVHKVLRRDGVFVLRLLSDNVGDVVTADVVHTLWADWRKEKNTVGVSHSHSADHFSHLWTPTERSPIVRQKRTPPKKTPSRHPDELSDTTRSTPMKHASPSPPPQMSPPPTAPPVGSKPGWPSLNEANKLDNIDGDDGNEGGEPLVKMDLGGK